jgi:ParB family protein of integrating conjugative element (PFGI_1 class)
LAVLRELWSETKEERFFRIACLFRPWSARGEIIALTGHLAENELRGNLSFIERALGVAKASELYEGESGAPLTQSELARRLTADGYPINQSHISRMQDTVRHLLPAIPTILYGGLGKHQIERLINLRKGAHRAWESHRPGNHPSVEFGTLFQDVLASFDATPDTFTVQRAQDELVGQMAQMLSVDYDTLALEIADSEARQLVLRHDPSKLTSLIPPPSEPAAPRLSPAPRVPNSGAPAPTPHHSLARADTPAPSTQAAALTPAAPTPWDGSRVTIPDEEALIAQHIVSPLQVSDRLQDIQRTIAAATGDTVPDFRANVLQAIPVQAGGLHPISDIWYIDAGLDSQEPLRVHIAQLAREIAAEAEADERIQSSPDGIGFSVAAASSTAPIPFFERAVVSLLSVLSTPYLTTASGRRHISDSVRLGDDLGALLQGSATGTVQKPDRLTRMSDVAIVKLFRLIRLARRLFELQSDDQTRRN